MFISHTWNDKFINTMDTLQYYYRDSPDVIIWLDMFSYNQHLVIDLETDWLCGTFKSAIKRIGTTIVVISPWDTITPLHRTWCLFELYCTKTTKNKFDIALSPDDKRRLINNASEKEIIEEIRSLFFNVDIEKSCCFKNEDQKRILKAISNKEIGVNNVETLVLEQIRESLITIMEEALNREINNIRKLSIMNNLGSLYKDQVKDDKAENIFVECLKKRTIALGDSHPDVLLTMNNLALLYYKKNKHDKAEQLLIECLQKRQQIFGNNHPDTIASTISLGNLYNSQGKFDKAEPLLLLLLSLQKETLGENHPDIIIAMTNLADLYKNLSNYEKSEYYYNECENKRKEVLGENK